MRTAAVLLVMIVAASGSAQAGTLNAATCARADVAAALAASTPGDTVIVPAGSCTWSSTLTIVKGITLRGGGADVTTIISGVAAGAFLLVYNPDAPSITTNAKMAISGFTFDMANNNSGGIWINNTSPTTPITNVAIHDNVFRNMSSTGGSTDVVCVRVGENGDAFGVAYRNTFADCKVVGNNYGAYEHSWNNTRFAYGSPNNFYWEDNTLTGNSAFHYGGHGGRYVARFNTYTFTAGDFQVLWDVHGNQPGGVYGTMGCEIYRNTVSLARSTTIIDHRGGSCMFFQNTLTGTNGSWQVREEYDDAIDPETNPQPQFVSDSYYFQNMLNGSNVRVTELTDCCNAIAENTHYFNQPATFNGTSGVGVGLIASRPATCSVGVGYWATDQGEWNALAAGADGQFYKCTGTNTWTLYYKPYLYPHPLRSTSAPPAPPKNLRSVP